MGGTATKKTVRAIGSTFVLLILFLPMAPMSSKPSTGNDSTPIVFVHGFAGSTLVDSNGATKWLNLWEGLGLKTPSLALPLTWESDVQARDELKPGEVLKSVQLVPGLFGMDIYGPWLEALGKLKRPVYQFVYDWRRDPLEVNEEFKGFLARISAEHSGKKLDVVGHSLGALYVMAAINQRPELFNQAILVGASFSGDINAFILIQEGDSTGLNDRILSPDVIFSFPSVYVFLPENESRIRDKDGKPENIDFYSVEDWKTHQFGPFFSAKDPDAIQEMSKYLQTALGHAKQFRRLIEPKPITYPKVRIVSGNAVPTRVWAIRDGSKRGLDFNSFPKEMGDGETRVADSIPKKGIPYELYYSDKGHIHLMDTPVILKLLSDGS
jgi:pimeloyl-ACP methyl ester carboxylesterase